VHDGLLGPEIVAGSLIQQIADDATEGTEKRVHETKHGSPVQGCRGTETGLQVREVGGIVGSQNAVDCEFRAEGAEVASAEDQCLRRGAHLQDLAKGGLLDDLATRRLEHLRLAHLCLVVPECATHLVDLLLILNCALRGRLAGSLAFLSDLAGNTHDITSNGVCSQVVLSSLSAFGPFAGRSVVRGQE